MKESLSEEVESTKRLTTLGFLDEVGELAFINFRSKDTFLSRESDFFNY